MDDELKKLLKEINFSLTVIMIEVGLLTGMVIGWVLAR